MFDLDQLVNSIIYSQTSSQIIGNPIYVSIIIVTFLLIMIIFMFKEHDPDEFWPRMINTSIYSMIFVLSIIIIHYKNLEKEFETRHESGSLNNLIQSTTNNPIL